MSQYKRMVSYLYKYINGAKSQNTGFVRIELMDKQCRFTVQMRMIPFEVYPKVYLYIQKEYGAKCIEVSDMGVKSGNLVSRFVLDSGNILQTGYSFDDIDGLIVYIGKEMFFATSWVKDEVRLGSMEIVSPNKRDSIFEKDNFKDDISVNNRTGVEGNRNNSFKDKADEKENIESIDENLDEKEEKNEGRKEDFHDNMLFDDNETGKGENEVASSAQTLEQDTATEEFDTEKVIIKASVYDESEKDFGERILSTFPMMYPFVSGIIEKSVRIELKDIGCLPIKMWVLANNAFLLHGYCSYRHIIFAKINVEDKKVQYAIGSPGVYNDYDEKIARQHGFIYFQPIGDVKDVCGAFGYWIHPLK